MVAKYYILCHVKSVSEPMALHKLKYHRQVQWPLDRSMHRRLTSMCTQNNIRTRSQWMDEPHGFSQGVPSELASRL